MRLGGGHRRHQVRRRVGHGTRRDRVLAPDAQPAGGRPRGAVPGARRGDRLGAARCRAGAGGGRSAGRHGAGHRRAAGPGRRHRVAGEHPGVAIVPAARPAAGAVRPRGADVRGRGGGGYRRALAGRSARSPERPRHGRVHGGGRRRDRGRPGAARRQPATPGTSATSASTRPGRCASAAAPAAWRRSPVGRTSAPGRGRRAARRGTPSRSPTMPAAANRSRWPRSAGPARRSDWPSPGR